MQIQAKPIRRALSFLRDAVEKHVFSLKRSIVLETNCDAPPVQPAGKVAFRQGSHADLERMAGEANGYGPHDVTFCGERLLRGDAMFIGDLDGEPVFSAWLMYGCMDLDLHRLFGLRPGVAYSYKLFTRNQARGHRICAAYYDFLKPRLQAQGCTKLVCRITPTNTSSLRAHARSGFRPVGTLWKLVLGPRSYYFADTELSRWLPTVASENAPSLPQPLRGSIHHV